MGYSVEYRTDHGKLNWIYVRFAGSLGIILFSCFFTVSTPGFAGLLSYCLIVLLNALFRQFLRILY